MIEQNLGQNNPWQRSNDYAVTCVTNRGVFLDGSLYIPRELQDFFGAEQREKRVIFLFEGREYPSYIEAEGPGADSRYKVSWSKALNSKFIGLFPDYESFFENVNENNQDETPLIYFEKMEETEFLVKMILPADEALTLKQGLFDFLGPGKSVASFKDSYEMVFFKHYLEQVDNRWRSDVFMVSAGVMKFYQARVNGGHEQDKNAEQTIDNILSAGLDDVLAFLMEYPYMTYADSGILVMENIDEHFYFSIDLSLVDELSTDDRRLMIEMLDQKIEYYFSRIDGPGLQENLTTLVNDYASFFTKDFRYSFKDVLTESIPACISGIPFIKGDRYKVVGFAGTDEWALVPWVSILDKNITRFPNVGVYLRYLLNKDTQRLYLALCQGFKDIETQVRKTGAENEETISMAIAGALEPLVEKARSLVDPLSFATDNEAVDLPDEAHRASIICYREYMMVPGDEILEADLKEMLSVYDQYYHRAILGEVEEAEEAMIEDVDETPEPTSEEEPQREEEDEQWEEDEEEQWEEDEEEQWEEDEEDDEEYEDYEEEEEDDLFTEELIEEDDTLTDAVSMALNNIDPRAAMAEKLKRVGQGEDDEAETREEDQPASPRKRKKTAKPAAKPPVKRSAKAKKSPSESPKKAAVTQGATVVGAAPVPLITEETLKTFKKIMEDSRTPVLPALNKRDRSLKREENLMPRPSDIPGTLRRMAEYITYHGFTCEEGLVPNFYLSLKAKPFVVVTGNAGVGKEQFVRLFAQSIGINTENGRFKQIPIRADWADSKGPLGYLDTNGQYIPGAIVDFVADAVDNPGLPFVLCLSEMAQAQIDWYFSEVLALLDTRREENGRVITDGLMDDDRFGRDEEARAYYKDLYLPANLMIVGTVSSEDAVTGLNRKVLDRANLVEIGQVPLQIQTMPANVPQAMPLGSEFLMADNLVLSRCTHHREMVHEVVTLLEAMNGILANADAQIGFRVRDEICFYLLDNAQYGLMSQESALDHAILQKILPRIQGTGAAVESVMTDLFKICAGTRSENGIRNYPGTGGLFPKSAVKLSKMFKRFEDEGFAAYWHTSV